MVVFLWQRQAKYIIAFASCTAYSHHFGAPQTTPYLTPAHDALQSLLSLSAPLVPSGEPLGGRAALPAPVPSPATLPAPKQLG